MGSVSIPLPGKVVAGLFCGYFSSGWCSPLPHPVAPLTTLPAEEIVFFVRQRNPRLPLYLGPQVPFQLHRFLASILPQIEKASS